MANLRATTAFFEFDFTLADTMFAQEQSTFGDNVNRTIGGKTFQDVASYETRSFSGYHAFYFGGTGLARGTDTALSAGTVTGFSKFTGRLDDFSHAEYRITGIALTGADVGAAMKTQATEDDIALLSKAFSGKDTFTLSDDADLANGYAGDDVIYGNDGGDLLYGGAGNDKVYGGAGDDQLEGGAGNDLLAGGGGVDTLSYQYADAGVTVDIRLTTAQDTGGAGIDTVSSFDRLYGSLYNDKLLGTGADNEIIGLGGNDVINGRGGNDRMDGSEGRDILTGGGGADSFVMFSLFTQNDRDLITDFSHAQGDHLLLSQLMFPGLSGAVDSPLSDVHFYKAAGATAAHDADDRIVYNTTSGWLYYDADGAGGQAAIQVFKLGLTTHPDLVASDILLSF
ncbi:calcium-binding protein [Novosphingobium percolationis]|uniref:calcium-binding protein n=1 Tax=Novosphingobium percolationis TaxID=2871811 RepID=UPI001CD62F26|nr:calcium-binding protein [Novosphingobium percolationis]